MASIRQQNVRELCRLQRTLLLPPHLDELHTIHGSVSLQSHTDVSLERTFP